MASTHSRTHAPDVDLACSFHLHSILPVRAYIHIYGRGFFRPNNSNSWPDRASEHEAIQGPRLAQPSPGAEKGFPDENKTEQDRICGIAISARNFICMTKKAGEEREDRAAGKHTVGRDIMILEDPTDFQVSMLSAEIHPACKTEKVRAQVLIE